MKQLLILIFLSVISFPTAHAQTWREIFYYAYTPSTDYQSSASWSPTGHQLLVYSHDPTFTRIYDPSTGDILLELPLDRLVWGADDSMLMRVDPLTFSITLYNSVTGAVETTLTDQVGGISEMAWSSDGQYLAVASWGGRLNIWSRNGQLLKQMRFTPHSYSFSLSWRPDSQAIAYADQGIGYIWYLFQEDVPSLSFYNVTGEMEWSPDGHYLAIVSDYTKIKIWNEESQNVITTFQDMTAPISMLQWHPTEHWLASASQEASMGWVGATKIWNLDTLTELATFDNHDWGLGPSWTASGEIFSIVDVTNLRIWDGTGQRLKFESRSIPLQHSVNSNGKYVALGEIGSTGNPYYIYIYDIETNALLATLQGHTDYIDQLEWSSDGLYLLSTSQDNTIRVWGRV